MRILAAVCAPGAAEAVAAVLRAAAAAGDTFAAVTLGQRVVDRHLGGSAEVFRRLELPAIELRDIGYVHDATAVPDAVADVLISQVRPDAILVGCSRDPSGLWSTIENALIRRAAAHGLGCVQLVDGWDVWYPRQTDCEPHAIAVPDELAQRLVERRGGRRAVVTGQPALDDLARSVCKSRRDALRRGLGVPPDTRVVGYFGQVSSDNPLTLGWTIEALGPRDRLLFVRHPRDQRSYASHLARASGRLLTGSIDAETALHVADLCITHSSTMGLKAAILGLPVINVLIGDEQRDLRKLCGGYPLAVLGLSREVHSRDELATALRTGVAPSDPSMVRTRLHLDGGAATRVLALLRSREHVKA